MLALLQLAVTFWSGYCLLQLVPIRWYKLEFWTAAYLVGLLITTWILFLCSLGFGYTVGLPLGLFLCGVGSFGIGKYFFKAVSLPKLEFADLPNVKVRLSIAGYIVFFAILFWAIFSHHSFLPKSNGWYSGGNTWADIALHSTLIYSFAENIQPLLQFPIYPAAKLTYPFLFDFYTAMLLRGGMSIQLALTLTSVLTVITVVTTLFFLLWRVTQSTFVASITSFLFLFNSNIGIWYFYQEWQASGLNFWRFIAELHSNYVHVEERGLYWTQVFIDLVLPQRGILVGMASFFVFCLVLYIYYQLNTLFISSEKKKSLILGGKLQTEYIVIIRYFFVFLASTMPFFHIHSFLVTLGVFCWYLFVDFFAHGNTWKTFHKHWLPPFLLLALLVAPQLYWQFGHTYGEGFTSIRYGWLKGENSLLSFWARNLGLQLLLASLGTIYLYHSKKSPIFLKIILLPLLALFVICNLVVFQPNIWDNTKFMVYSHWAMVVICALLLHKLLQFVKERGHVLRSLAIGVVVLCIVVLTSGGTIAVVREFQLNWQSVSTKDLAMTEWVKANTPPDAVFLTSSTHNHPIPMLTGRPIVMGYPGWLWTYGIDYSVTEQEVKQIYRGEPIAHDLLVKHSVDYIYLGNHEKIDLRANQNFLQQFPLVYQTEEIAIYQVSKNGVIK